LIHLSFRHLSIALGVLVLAAQVCAQESPAAVPTDEPDLVDLHVVDPTIVIDLRYATSRNIARRPLYPLNMPALVRPSVAKKLVQAQDELLTHGFRLKIWDAWRPKSAHDELWRLFPDKNYVGNPSDGFGSLHTWGVAVDATMVDDLGRDVAMPTDFDAFSPAAMLQYTGKDPQVAAHLHTLQRAMAHAGFWGMRTEWWHFIARGWNKYRAIEQLPIATQPARDTAAPLSKSSQASSDQRQLSSIQRR
jgi:D-alanyl-D-alanine dipeptidase